MQTVEDSERQHSGALDFGMIYPCKDFHWL
jgi:hypothetical protein